MKNKAIMNLMLALMVYIGLLSDNILPESTYEFWNEKLGRDNAFILYGIIISIIWGSVCYISVKIAEKYDSFYLFEKKENSQKWQLVIVCLLVILSIVASYVAWDGSKVLKEFYYHGLLKFTIQYIYYMFETMIILLIIVFSQKAFELLFNNKYIPYGGIFLSLTWGMTHIISKDLFVGIYLMFFSLLYGIAYLLLNRDFKKAYIVIFLMFVL